MVAVLAAAAALIFGSSADAANSVAFQINARHSGHQADPNLDPPFHRLWAREFPNLTSYPLIVGDRVFITVRNTSTYGTALYALARRSGRIVWRQPLGGIYYWSGIAFGGGRVYAINGDGILSAFDPDSGARRWRLDLPHQWSFDAAPTYKDRMVYVSGSGFGGTFYAVTRNGKLAWTQPVQNGGESSPAVGKRRVFASYACAQTYAFNPVTGARAWHWDAGCEGGGGRTAVLHRGRLYVRDDRSGYVLSAFSGNLVDRFVCGPSVGGPPPAFRGTEGFLVVDQKLEAFNVKTGKTDWIFRDPHAASGGAITSTPLVVNRHVVVGSSEGELYAVNVATGRRTWHGDVGKPIAGPDEQNDSQPLTGLGAGKGTLVVPAETKVVAYRGS